MELYIVARRAASTLSARGARVVRVYCGSFMTSLDMAGVSVTVMRVDNLLLSRCCFCFLARKVPSAAVGDSNLVRIELAKIASL